MSTPDRLTRSAGSAQATSVRRTARQCGISLIELIMFIIIVGIGVAGLGAYSATIAIAAVALGTVPAPDSLQITITVSGPGNNTLVLQGYRTRYAPNAP